MDKLNIMIVGVGGQGTLLASRVIGNVALKKGYDVKMSEVHGMSQRGGSVVTYVKIDQKVYSPIIDQGEADMIIAFEELEALRWMAYLRESGNFILNTQKIDPMPVIIGRAQYPEGIQDILGNQYKKLISIDALTLAKKCGSIKAVNIVLLGVMASLTDIEKEVWLDSLKEVVPPKTLAINIKAFEEGYSREI